MRKALFPLPFLFLFLLFFPSCQAGATPPPKNESIRLENEYRIGIEYMNFATKGMLIIQEDGSLYFKHEDPNSILNGMEEIISEDKIIVKYKGIEWESGEVETGFYEIKAVFDAITKQEPSDCKTTSVRGIETKMYSFQSGKDTIFFHTEKSSGKPVQITGSFSDLPFSINFYNDTVKNELESAA